MGIHPCAGAIPPMEGWHCEGPGIGWPFFTNTLRVPLLEDFGPILFYV